MRLRRSAITPPSLQLSHGTQVLVSPTNAVEEDQALEHTGSTHGSEKTNMDHLLIAVDEWN